MPNFMEDANMYAPTVIKCFESIDEAVKHVAEHDGFIIGNDNNFAYRVKSIGLLK